jgi:hypothetical protein
VAYTIRHTIETDTATFWKLAFDTEFNRYLMQDVGSFEVIEERTDHAGVLHRQLAYAPRFELPSLLTKLVGDGSYTEFGSYDPAAQKYSARCVPKLGADKFSTHFEISTEALGPTRCERVVVAENVVKIFGIGKAIADVIERAHRESQTQVVARINAWVLAPPT